MECISLDGDRRDERSTEPARIHTPEEIALRLGGISLKSLGELIRKSGVETTTLGFAAPSRKGGPGRRLWGMTAAQLEEYRAGGSEPAQR